MLLPSGKGVGYTILLQNVYPTARERGWGRHFFQNVYPTAWGAPFSFIACIIELCVGLCVLVCPCKSHNGFGTTSCHHSHFGSRYTLGCRALAQAFSHEFDALRVHFCRQTWKHRNTDTATVVERAAR